MQHDYRYVTGGDGEKSNGSAGEILGSIGRDLESPGEVPRGTSNTFTQRLGVATSRALERRLGMSPSQTDVCKVVNALTGNSSRFLRCAERVQAQLARLHSELQKSQEPRSRIDITQEITASSNGSDKRPLEEPDRDSSNQPKRAHLENGNPNPHKSPPPFNPVQAPSAPMVQKHAPIVPQGSLSDPQLAEASCMDGSASPHARVDFPTQTPVTGIGKPTSTDLSKSDSDREIEQRTPSRNTADAASHENRGHTEALPPSTVTSAPGVQQSPLTISGTQPQDSRTDSSLNGLALPGVAVVVGLPAYTRQQMPPSAPAPSFVANVPGIWAIQVGKPSSCQVDLSFEVDEATAGCIRRWATRRQSFGPDVRHVVVHLVALQATAVSAAQKVLSQSPGIITPQVFALALHGLQPQWPNDGTLVLQLNAGQPEEQSWSAFDMSAGQSLDVSGAVLAGTNSLRILQLRNMAELVFALYATLPTAEMLAGVKQRNIYSFRRPHSKRLFE